MMSGILKTHEMIRDLECSGFSKKQAEALADWQTKIAEDTFATKSDLLELKHDMTVKIYSAQIAGVVLTVGILKLIM